MDLFNGNIKDLDPINPGRHDNLKYRCIKAGQWTLAVIMALSPLLFWFSMAFFGPDSWKSVALFIKLGLTGLITGVPFLMGWAWMKILWRLWRAIRQMPDEPEEPDDC